MTKSTKAATTPATKTIQEVILEQAAAGKTTTQIRGYLQYLEVKADVITAEMKIAGLTRTTSKFTQTDTLRIIEDGITEFDLYDRLLEEKAVNELRWINDRNRIRITMNKVIARLSTPVAEFAATTEQKKAAAEIVQAAKKK